MCDEAGIAWWNRLTETQRRHWLNIAGSARPVDVWRAYQRRADTVDELRTTLASLPASYRRLSHEHSGAPCNRDDHKLTAVQATELFDSAESLLGTIDEIVRDVDAEPEPTS